MGTITLLLIVLLVITGFVTRPPALGAAVSVFALKDLPQTHLELTETAAHEIHPITSGAEKRIRWAGTPGERTQHVVIYIHGFSATRQEIAPVPELVADALGANLFETRLTGHGLLNNGPLVATGEEWLRDGAEALAIGEALGDELIIMGTSTGATLATAMAEHPGFDAVSTLVFVSPNFGPASAGSGIMTGPFGPQLTRLLVGERTSWDAANDAQEMYWTTDYPSSTLVEMMRLVDLANALTPTVQVPNAFLVYSPKDDVVSVEKFLAAFEALPAGRKGIHKVDDPDSLSPHVLSGDILAPGTSEGTAAVISDFIRVQDDS
ncbi:MAG: alpha/beta fold hydrolase [Pseudomonadota bacterium]